MVKCLVVVAHPDDEIALAVTIYKITHELKGIVDHVTVTNGEGGFRYSLLAEPYYGLNLTNEETGRKNLVFIRKQELMNVRAILKMRHLYNLDQKDTYYSLDIREPLSVWDIPYVKTRLKTLIERHRYDVVFFILPHETTHAHHKAAGQITLEVISTLDVRPLVLGATLADAATGNLREYNRIEGYAYTEIREGKPRFQVDRRVTFGHQNRVSYKTIVNWVIAAYKSQGGLQTLYNKSDFENFWFFDLNSSEHLAQAEKLFQSLNDYRISQ